jgi:hypothetical protein
MFLSVCFDAEKDEQCTGENESGFATPERLHHTFLSRE